MTYTFTFGKYQGQTIEETLKEDRNYVMWAMTKRSDVKAAYAEFMAPTKALEENYKMAVRQICKKINATNICRVIRKLGVSVENGVGISFFNDISVANATLEFYIEATVEQALVDEPVWKFVEENTDKPARTLEQIVIELNRQLAK